MGKHIERAFYEQFGGQGQFLCLFLCLPLDLVAPIQKCRLPGLASAPDKFIVDVPGTAVDDRMVEWSDPPRTHLLFAQAHHQLGFHGHGPLPGSAISPADIQGVDVVWAVGGNLQNRPPEGAGQVSIFPFRINDNNVIAGRQGDKGNGLLHAEGLAGTGHSQNKTVGIQKLLPVADQEIPRYSVDAAVDSPRILDLLDPERHQDGGALSGEGAGSGNAPQAIGQGRIEPVLLLIPQDGELAGPLLPNGLQGLGVRIQLVQGVRNMDQRDIAVDHALVTGAEIIQKLPVLRPELFQLIGDRSGEVVAVVLPLLPAGDVALHAHDALLHIPDSLSGRNGQDVNGEHQVSWEVRQLGNQGVLDVAGIVPQEQDSPEPAPHLKVVCPKTHSIRTDIVPEVVPQAHGAPQVKAVILFLSRAEKAVEDAQALMGIQDPRPAVQLAQIFCQVRIHPMEKGPGLLHVFPGRADGDVLVLHQVIAASGLVHKDVIVLPAITVKTVPLLPHEDGLLEIDTVEAPVIDGDFCGGVSGQAVEDGAVGGKHLLLVLIGRQGVVDIREAPGLAELAVDLPDAVPIDTLDGDGLLDAAGDLERGAFASIGGGKGFKHGKPPPFPCNASAQL